MNSRIYIGRLSYRVRERDIERFLKNYGRVREIMLKNGYGFVEFEDSRDADDAVFELNGRELCGERVVIEHAKGIPHGRDAWKDRERGIEYTNKRERYDDGDKPKASPSGFRCVIENVSTRATKHDIKDLLRKCGDILNIEFRSDYATVEFMTAKDMKYAIDKYYGVEFMGHKIKLFEEKPSDVRSKKRSYSPTGKSPVHASISRSKSRSSASVRSHSRSPKKSKARGGSREHIEGVNNSNGNKIRHDSEKSSIASSYSRSPSR
ncbi:unnamed protein product [Gordionus sp. m RMFG-2023]|uniref:serine/arginine-rich splicing factor 6-like n=1 Tax=Gordionus sp. m RMFG-2023 TaxID=3053472 RepID=UPI0030E34F6B